MSAHAPSDRTSGPSAGVSRRRFVLGVLAGAAAMAGHPGAAASPSGQGTALTSIPWDADARAIVTSGALGTVRWIEASYPGGTDWARGTAPLLAAVGAEPHRSRRTAIGAGAPTIVVEADDAPPIYLAPRLAGSVGETVIRGTTASLLIRSDGLWLRPEAPRGPARRRVNDGRAAPGRRPTS